MPEAAGSLQRQLRLTNSSYSLRPSSGSQSQSSFFGPMAVDAGEEHSSRTNLPELPICSQTARVVVSGQNT